LTRPPVNGTRRITLLALLTAIALTIFMVEAQLPVLVPIQGVKLGLANIVTVYAVFILGPADALLILVARVFLGAVFSGQMMTLLYSMGGGLLAWLAMVVLRKLLSQKEIWLCSPVAAVFHNLGQLLVAAGIMRTWAVMAYFPYLLLSGVITGLFTGLCAQFLIGRLKKIQKN
jgi:heptaprenyl diphosphate synthase